MFSTILIIAFLLAILVNLGLGLRHILKEEEGSKRAVRSLTWRIVLSLLLFVILFSAFALGVLRPHAL